MTGTALSINGMLRVLCYMYPIGFNIDIDIDIDIDLSSHCKSAKGKG